MTVRRGFAIVVLSGAAFALAGAAIGYTLGAAMPGYYRAVFASGREPWFDPVAVGLGQGLTQGLVCGLAVGSVVVLATAWYGSRRRVTGEEFRAPWAGGRADPASRSQDITSRPT